MLNNYIPTQEIKQPVRQIVETINIPRTYPVSNNKVKEIINHSKTFYWIVNDEPMDMQKINKSFGADTKDFIDLVWRFNELVEENIFDYITHFDLTFNELRYLRYLDEN